MIKRGISRLHRVSREIPEAKIINKEEDTCRNFTPCASFLTKNPFKL